MIFDHTLTITMYAPEYYLLSSARNGNTWNTEKS